jgi:hypothetical protein
MVAHLRERSLYTRKIVRFLEESTIDHRFNEVRKRKASGFGLATPRLRWPLGCTLLLKIVNNSRNLSRGTLDFHLESLWSGDLSFCHIQVFFVTLLQEYLNNAIRVKLSPRTLLAMNVPPRLEAL